MTSHSLLWSWVSCQTKPLLFAVEWCVFSQSVWRSCIGSYLTRWESNLLLCLYLFTSDMCNTRTAARPAALFGAACVVLFMVLEWYFKWIIVLTFSCYSFHNHLPQAFALDQKFAALELHEQKTVLPGDHRSRSEYKFSRHLLLLCYRPA